MERYHKILEGNNEWEFDEKWQSVNSTNMLKPKARLVKNALVGIIGISEYDRGNDNLEGVDEDVMKNIGLWHEYFGYDTKVLASTPSKNKIYADEITKFIEDSLINPMVISQQTDQNYDGLVLLLSGHGKSKGIITSNNALYPLQYIQQYFSKEKELLNLPKLFVVNTCRGSKFAKIVTVPKNLRTKWRGDGPTQIHPDSDINTLYSTTDGHPVPDSVKFVNTMNDVIRKTDLTKYHLSEVTTLITEEIGNKRTTFDYYCPEYVKRSKYLIFMEKKSIKGKIDWIYVERKDYRYMLKHMFTKKNVYKIGRGVVMSIVTYWICYSAYCLKQNKYDQKPIPNIWQYNNAIKSLVFGIGSFVMEIIKANK